MIRYDDDFTKPEVVLIGLAAEREEQNLHMFFSQGIISTCRLVFVGVVQQILEALQILAWPRASL